MSSARVRTNHPWYQALMRRFYEARANAPRVALATKKSSVQRAPRKPKRGV